MFPEQELYKEIRIQAPASATWKVLTNPELIRLWIFEDETVRIESEWKTGAAIHFRSLFHDLPFEGKGTIRVFEPGKQFTYTFWNNLSQLPDKPEFYFVIDFTLMEHGAATMLSVHISNLQNPEIYGHWNFYWQVTLDLIRRLAEKGA